MNRTSDSSKNDNLIVTKENEIQQIVTSIQGVNETIDEIKKEIVKKEKEIERRENTDPGNRLELKKIFLAPLLSQVAPLQSQVASLRSEIASIRQTIECRQQALDKQCKLYLFKFYSFYHVPKIPTKCSFLKIFCIL